MLVINHLKLNKYFRPKKKLDKYPLVITRTMKCPESKKAQE